MTNNALKDRYLQMLMTNVIGNTYRVNQSEEIQDSVTLHRQMLQQDPEYMAKAAVYAREHGYTRLQPIIALAYLSTAENKAPFHAAFKRIISTPSNLFDFIRTATSIRNGKGFGRTIKRAIGNWYNSLSEYHVMKYGSESKTDRSTGVKSYDLKDILKLIRPIPSTAKQKELFKYILDRSDVDYSKLPQLHAYERLKKEKDMGNIRALIREGRIPHEVATGVISRPDLATWTAIMKEMPVFALLRNLNTLQNHAVLDNAENRAHVTRTLTDENIITRSKILPYRFLKAHEVFNGWREIKDALETATNTSFVNVPSIVGSTHLSIDISGSMLEEERITHASIFGAATFMKADNVEVTLFNTTLHPVAFSKSNNLVQNMKKIPTPYGGTALSLPVQHLLGTLRDQDHLANGFYRVRTGYDSSFALQNRRTTPTFVDNIIIVTDEQENAGQTLVNTFNEYRRTVNPNAKLFIINVSNAPVRSMPVNDPNVHYVFGWSDQVLQYVSFVSHGFAGQRDHVEALQLSEDAVAVRR